MKKKLFSFAVGLVFLPMSAYAQLSTPSNDGNLVSGSLSVVLKDFIEATLAILASLSILVIIISGIVYITSGGDDGRVEVAKKMLTYAIVGLVVALLGYIIVYAVGKALGI